MIFYPAATIAGLAFICALVAGGLVAVSEDGVPHWIPALGSLGLLAVALEMERRSRVGGRIGRLWSALADTYAVGAALAGLRAPEFLFDAPVVLTGLQWLLAGILVAAAVRVVLLMLRLRPRLTRHRLRVALAATSAAIVVVGVAVLAGPPSSPVAAAVIAFAVYGANAGAPLYLFASLGDPKP